MTHKFGFALLLSSFGLFPLLGQSPPMSMSSPAIINSGMPSSSPSIGSLNASAGGNLGTPSGALPSFRPASRSQRGGLQKVGPGLNDIIAANRGQFGPSVAPLAPANTAGIARLRALQAIRGRQAMAIGRPMGAGAARQVGLRLVPGFSASDDLQAAGLSPPVSNNPLDRRFAEFANRLNSEDLRVRVDRGVATVTGSLRHAQQRGVLRQFLLLEPGIDAVDDQTSVPDERQ